MSETSRWRVSDAIRDEDCELPPTARHVMHALIARADTESAVIPARHSPSLQRLAKDTGMGKTAVSIALNKLEKRGWLLRHRPSTAAAMRDHARTNYELVVPPGCSRDEREAVREANRGTAVSSPQPVRDADGGSAPDEPDPVRDADDTPFASRTQVSSSPEISPGSPAWAPDGQSDTDGHPHEWEPAVDDPYAFLCPTCVALPGDPCRQRGKRSATLTTPHARRPTRRKCA